MRYTKRFLMSFVAGAGSAIGAFVGKECMVIVKNGYKRKGAKEEVKENNDQNLKEGKPT